MCFFYRENAAAPLFKLDRPDIHAATVLLRAEGPETLRAKIFLHRGKFFSIEFPKRPADLCNNTILRSGHSTSPMWRATLPLPDGDKATTRWAPVDSNHPQFTAAYRYDGLDRMTTNSIAGTGTWSYTYDANGNRTSSSGLPFVNSTTSNRLNNIPASPVVYFGYDATGNQTSRGGTTFVYDNVGRMVKTTEGSTVLGTYTYNAIGQRMQKRYRTPDFGREMLNGTIARMVFEVTATKS